MCVKPLESCNCFLADYTSQKQTIYQKWPLLDPPPLRERWEDCLARRLIFNPLTELDPGKSYPPITYNHIRTGSSHWTQKVKVPYHYLHVSFFYEANPKLISVAGVRTQKLTTTTDRKAIINYNLHGCQLHKLIPSLHALCVYKRSPPWACLSAQAFIACGNVWVAEVFTFEN